MSSHPPLKGMLHGWRSNAKIVALGGAGTVPGMLRDNSPDLFWARAMFWLSLAFAMALLALALTFIWFVDQFVDRVKRTRHRLQR